jgi:hypothetical protein
MSNSRFAFGSGARFGGCRRRDGWDERSRGLRSAVFSAGLRSGAFRSRGAGSVPAAAAAVAPSTGFFFRLRPPRVPRRRFFGAFGSVGLGCPAGSCVSAGASTVSGSTCGASAAAEDGAFFSDGLRRNQGSGKRSLL